MSADQIALIGLILLASLYAVFAIRATVWAVRRYRRGAPSRALKRQQRAVARVNQLSAEYVAEKYARSAAATPRHSSRVLMEDTTYEEVGVGDLLRPIYPASPASLDGDMSDQLGPSRISKTCAWSVKPCHEPVASELSYCVGHLRRIRGASTPEVKSS